jgi:uncharacterized protein YbgA (DUF1722 family)/uncharacterized protein YbbK (DUF523 family)
VSSCLLGQRVRYDGGHKRDAWIALTLARQFELVPICPEVAIGLGVPRPPIHLVRRGGKVRAVGVRDRSLDVTSALTRYGREMASSLNDLRGYVFKARSPSCGTGDVTVRGQRDLRDGLYAAEIRRRHPLLPVENETSLDDPAAREHFIRRIQAYARLRALLDAPTAAALIAFHSDHKYLLLACSPAAYRELGHITAGAGRRLAAERAAAYATCFMDALTRAPTPARHVNVLQHIAGFFRPELGARARQTLAASIAAFHAGDVSRAVPLAQIHRNLRQHPHEWLARQVYLDPLPLRLALRK